MEFTEFGDGDDRILFVLGWGNRPHQEPVQWLVEKLVDAGYTVDVGQIPDHGSDFDAEYVRPTQERHDATDPDRILSHSTGGLAVAHIDSDAPRVYLSPWWGMAGDSGLLERVFVSLPTERPVIPAPIEPAALGDLATAEQVAEGPDKIAPAFLRTAGSVPGPVTPGGHQNGPDIAQNSTYSMR